MCDIKENLSKSFISVCIHPTRSICILLEKLFCYEINGIIEEGTYTWITNQGSHIVASKGCGSKFEVNISKILKNCYK